PGPVARIRPLVEQLLAPVEPILFDERHEPSPRPGAPQTLRADGLDEPGCGFPVAQAEREVHHLGEEPGALHLGGAPPPVREKLLHLRLKLLGALWWQLQELVDGPFGSSFGAEQEGVRGRPHDQCGAVIPAIDGIAVVPLPPLVLALEGRHVAARLRAAELCAIDVGLDATRPSIDANEVAELDRAVLQIDELVVVRIALVFDEIPVAATPPETVVRVVAIAAPGLVDVREREEALAVEGLSDRPQSSDARPIGAFEPIPRQTPLGVFVLEQVPQSA